MDDSIENLMQSIVSGNQQSRARFEKAMARTADAIYQGDEDELGNIVRDAAGDAGGDDTPAGTQGGPESMETGDTVRSDGGAVTNESSGGNAEEPSS